MLAVLCPGQGAQSPGFLAPWLDVDGVRDQLRRLSTRAYFDLAARGCDPHADVIDTAVAQPLLVAAGIVSASLLGPLPAGSVVVGHSIGEVTAAAVAGMVRPEVALDLARERGRAMAAAAATTRSSMTAVLGGDRDAVLAAVEAAGCWIANDNGAGQLVAAGSEPALGRLADTAPPGARLRPLAVAGAFHTPLMSAATGPVAIAVAATPVQPGVAPIVSNADGALVHDGEEFLGSVARQVTAPVRFDRCIQTLRELGVTATIELAPAGVLTGLVRRQLPDVEPLALRSPEDLAAAQRLCDRLRRDAAQPGDGWAEEWRVLVAPATGTLHRRDGADGVIRNRSGEVPLQATRRDVLEWLAEDGDPVAEGQPLARLAAS